MVGSFLFLDFINGLVSELFVKFWDFTFFVGTHRNQKGFGGVSTGFVSTRTHNIFSFGFWVWELDTLVSYGMGGGVLLHPKVSTYHKFTELLFSPI